MCIYIYIYITTDITYASALSQVWAYVGDWTLPCDVMMFAIVPFRLLFCAVVYALNMYICIYIYIYTYIHTYTYTYIHIYIYVYIYIYIYIYTHTYTQLCLYIYIYIHMSCQVSAYSCLPFLACPGHWGLTTIMMLIHHLNAPTHFMLIIIT